MNKKKSVCKKSLSDFEFRNFILFNYILEKFPVNSYELRESIYCVALLYVFFIERMKNTYGKTFKYGVK